MNLRDFATSMTRSWLLIVAAGAVGLAGGWAASTIAQPVYVATSKVAVVATNITEAESAQQITAMIRSELSLYSALAKSTPVADRVASRVDGVSPTQVAGATAPSTSDQVLVLTITLPDAIQAEQVARAAAEEVAIEIENLHPEQPQLVRAEAMEIPVVAASEGASTRATMLAGGVVGLTIGIILAWWVAALRPQVGAGRALAADGRLILRAEPDAGAYGQLAALLMPRLEASDSGAVALVGTGSQVNLGPWSSGLAEQLGAQSTAITVAAHGADPVALRAVAGGTATVLVADRCDDLNAVRETCALLEAAGAQLAAVLVVSDSRA